MKVITFGTFDGLHPGHLNYLRQALKYGDELFVVVARDDTVKKLKGKSPKLSAEERKKQLEESGLPDKVLIGNPGDKYKIIEDIRPDVICLGYDQRFFTDTLEEELKKRNIDAKVVRLKPFKEDIFKSSKLSK